MTRLNSSEIPIQKIEILYVRTESLGIYLRASLVYTLTSFGYTILITEGLVVIAIVVFNLLFDLEGIHLLHLS